MLFSVQHLTRSIIVVLVTCITSLANAQNTTFTITIDAIEDIEGELCVRVYDSEETYLEEDQEVKKIILDVTKSKMSHSFSIPHGVYAISVFHDKNRDHECNRNFLGIPQEKYGFSNNFVPKLSMPKFKQCKFNTREQSKMTIKLII